MNKKIKHFCVSCTVLVLSFLFFTGRSDAEEINLSVSGNGSGSQSEVSVQTTSNTTVEQSNSANITNNVTNNANTGGNSANNTTNGNAAIQTGDASINTNVSNNSINSNNVSNTCSCNTSASATVSGNGSDSNNSIEANHENSNTVSQTNITKITNNLNISGNTGTNAASNNSGNIDIKTGNVYAKINVENKNINSSHASVASSFFSTVFEITGNGTGSENKIIITVSNENIVTVRNLADILNRVNQDFNTGKNTADNNLGNVHIGTGDIFAELNIVNSDINSSVVNVDCGCKKETPPSGDGNTPAPSGPNPPIGGGPGGSGGNGGGGNGGSVLGTTAGEVLPETGNFFFLFLTLGFLFVFLMGLYLRMHSGNSPGRHTV